LKEEKKTPELRSIRLARLALALSDLLRLCVSKFCRLLHELAVARLHRLESSPHFLQAEAALALAICKENEQTAVVGEPDDAGGGAAQASEEKLSV
jgi:hypothetical protein